MSIKKSNNFHRNKINLSKPVALIIGGENFIGSYLSELLLFKNCQVIFNGNLTNNEKINFSNCFKNKSFIYIIQNLKSQPFIPGRLDYLFYLDNLENHININKRSSKNIKAFIHPLEIYLEIAKQKAKFLYASPLLMSNNSYYFSNQEKKILHYQVRKDLDARVIRLGEVYGPRMNLQAEGRTHELFIEAIKKKSLTVGTFPQLLYPTFVADVVYGLAKAMFSSGTKGKIFNLINSQGIYDNELALEISQQSKVELKINSSLLTNSQSNFNYPQLDWKEITKSQNNLSWEARTKIKQGISQTLSYFTNKTKRNDFWNRLMTIGLGKTGKKKNHRFGKIMLKIFIFIMLIFLAIFYPWVLMGINGGWGVLNLKWTQKVVLKGSFDKITNRAFSAQKAFSRAKENSFQAGHLYRWLNKENLAIKIENNLSIGIKVSQGVAYGGEAVQSANSIAQIILQSQEGDAGKLIPKLSADLTSAYEAFSLAEAGAKNEKSFWLSMVPFEKLRNVLLKAKTGVEVLPEIIGVNPNSKKVFLILLQNNMELRPTGGFIGSYALATFANGKLLDFNVQDVYNADGQLKGHVEPPLAIKKYLGEAGWYLRDANWDPDFSVTASRVEWFLEKETAQKVDGVIGVNLYLAQDILSQIGTIDLPDLQEKITADNLFERAEYHAEIGFFPGSTQKKDFLSSLSRALFENIISSDRKTWWGIGKATLKALEEKDLLIYLNEASVRLPISQLNADGKLRTISCLPGINNCFLDYLMIVEANVGVNKSNYYVKRDLFHNLEIDNFGTVKESLVINYQNQSPNEFFPAGRYKNYLRVLLPRGTQLNRVIINNNEVKQEEIDWEKVGNRESFGFLVEVPIREQRKVEVNYQLARKVNLKQPVKYLFLLQKQSGIKDQVFNFQFNLPQNYYLSETQPTAIQKKDSFFFAPEFRSDLVFETTVDRLR